MRKKKKKRTKTTHGINRRAGLCALLLAFVLTPSPPACAKDKNPKQQAFAIVAGTVFRESGLALPGAEVTLTPDAKPGKPQRQISDVRGEFAFRVPSEPARYRVAAAAKHFEAREKTVEIEGHERAEVTLSLPESSKE